MYSSATCFMSAAAVAPLPAVSHPAKLLPGVGGGGGPEHPRLQPLLRPGDEEEGHPHTHMLSGLSFINTPISTGGSRSNSNN